ncbi:PTS IIA-like nitrogen regulatory protein PtsN [Pseudoalteromonas xiamenensis]|uniref:PTS IIA-like nitrogen regulatory protein PtsN n=1 Tax=Pseudoalteromonas xiamenensis TaxID=882626 RepID=UPI0027E50F63|nr:PTS IIA-like nitrogen regulatory protein PtsN [Pseudoalteromonas xiamenensis]WMN61283.1 PTS IIA-like nitrogen regulatory protein PtsN [Pseudoalteromonas xiamenensis]
MKLSELISKDCTKAAVLFTSKKRVLEYLSELAQQQLPEVDQHEILDALLAREKLGSTGIGKGVALPHGRLTGIEKPLVMLLTNQEAIDYDAIDNRPVDVFVGLIVPEGEHQSHLKTLATIADKLRDKEYCRRLRHAQTDEELFEVLDS